MARTRSNRRQFEWARAAGFGEGEVQGAAALGAVDLLAAVRQAMGRRLPARRHRYGR